MKKTWITALTALGLAISLSAGAAETKAKPEGAGGGPTKEQREKMADAHEKMAGCLRSDKSIEDCHQEMAQSCRENMGDQCPMHGMMGKMHGKMHGKKGKAAPPKED